MRRRGWILALGAALVALVVLAPGGAAKPATRCRDLSSKGDLAPAKRVKLVERQRKDAKVLVGCVLGHRIFIVATRYDDPSAHGDYHLREVVGHVVVVDGSLNASGGTTRWTDVFNLKTGRRYGVASRCHPRAPDWGCGHAPNETVERVFANAGAQAAAVLGSESSDIVSVVGYSARGNRVVLDSGTRSEIPPSSLELDGHVASWTHNGVRKSARLPKVSECQKLKARNDLAPTHRAKLVERANEDNGTDLVGCVLPRGKVSVVASSGKESGLERSYKVKQVAGHQVLVRGDVINPYGHGVSTYVYDLERARSYTIAETCFHDTGAPCEPQTMAKRAFVNRRGQAAAIVTTEGSSTVRVVGFRSTGERAVLDSGGAQAIPASSLQLDGHVVRWTHSGTPRSATLSG